MVLTYDKGYELMGSETSFDSKRTCPLHFPNELMVKEGDHYDNYRGHDVLKNLILF